MKTFLLLIFICFVLSAIFFSCATSNKDVYNHFPCYENCPPDTDGVFRSYIVNLGFKAPYESSFTIRCEAFFVYLNRDSIYSIDSDANICLKEFIVLNTDLFPKKNREKYIHVYESFFYNESSVFIPLRLISSIAFFPRSYFVHDK